MDSLDAICQDVVLKVDAAIACGLIDRASGLLLAQHRVGPRSQVLDDERAAALVELFFASALPDLRPGGGGLRALLELHLRQEESNTFAKVVAPSGGLLVLVTGRSTSVGMAWTQLAWAASSVEALLGGPTRAARHA